MTAEKVDMLRSAYRTVYPCIVRTACGRGAPPISSQTGCTMQSVDITRFGRMERCRANNTSFWRLPRAQREVFVLNC